MLDRQYAMDKVLRDIAKTGLVPPFNLPGDPLRDHFISITENLFIAYPYWFRDEQITQLVESANQKGFQVIVDPIASRYRGGNLRIIIWQVNPKNAKK